MKNFFIILLLVLLFSACKFDNRSTKIYKQYKFTVDLKIGSGWNAGFSRIECDSFQMTSLKEAYVWVDGHKSKIIADRILIQTN